MSLMESEPAWPARQSRFLLGYCLWGKAWMMHNSPFSISDGGTRSPRLVAFVADVRRRLIAVLVTTSELVPSRFLASLAQRRSPRDCFHPFLFRSPKTGGARHLSLIFFPLFFSPMGGNSFGQESVFGVLGVEQHRAGGDFGRGSGLKMDCRDASRELDRHRRPSFKG